MLRILHMSDLHLKKGDDYSARLDNMIDTINQNYSKLDVLVITGDLKNWNEDFETSISFINKLVEELGINDVILTPGNHDVECLVESSLEYEESTGTCNIFNDKITNDSLNKPYKSFFDACKRIKNCKNKNPIEVISAGKVNFLVVSSVCGYDAKKNNPFCCNCKKLHDYIQNKLHQLLSEDKINIYITHSNDESMCKSILYSYPEKINIRNITNQLFHIKLFGHIHSSNNIHEDSIVQLSVGNSSFLSDSLKYNIYSINSANCSYAVDYLYFGEEGWDIDKNEDYNKLSIHPKLEKDYKLSVLTKEYLADIYHVSEQYLKSTIFDKKTSGCILNISRNKNDIRIGKDVLFNEIKVTDFFKSIIKLKQSTPLGFTKRTVESNLFEQIYGILRQSKENSIPLTIKGNIGTGKTTFLNLLYIYLILKSQESFEFIPVYLDVPKALQNDNIEKTNQMMKELQRLNKQFIIILDGMDEKCVTCLDYNEIDKLLEGFESAIYIFGINSHINTIRDKEVEYVSINRNSDWLIYFNSKTTTPNYIFSYHNNESFFDFADLIKRYLDMVGYDYNDNLIHRIKDFFDRYRINYIDYHLLYYVVKVFIHETVHYTLVQLLNKSLSENYKGKKEIIQTFAYHYAYKKDLLLKLKSGFRSEDLKSQILVDYLVARHIAKLIDKNDLTAKEFNNYYSKSVNCFLVEFIKNETINISSFVSNLIQDFEKLSLVAKTQLMFLMRHIKDESLSKLIENQKLIKTIQQENYVQQAMFNRTLLLSKNYTAKGRHKHKSVYGILNRLIREPNFAKINRQFNLFYYNDIRKFTDDINKHEELMDISFSIKKTIDNNLFTIFRNYDCCILNDGKINIHLTRECQDMIDINVFNVVNILQQCIMYYQNLKVLGNRYALIEDVLFMTDFLSKYISCYYRDSELEGIVYSYYLMMFNDFNNFLNNVFSLEPEMKEKYDEKFNSIEPAMLTKSIYNLSDYKLFRCFDTSNVIRKGWQERCNLGTLRLESSAENSMQLMLLALLIPDTELDRDSKKRLCDIAFLHNLAEGIYEDKMPSDKDYAENKNMVNQTLLFFTLIGTYYTKVNLSEYFPLAYSLFMNSYDSTIEIFEDLKVIQRYLKYKYYIDSGAIIIESRKKEFEREFGRLRTTAGNDIKNRLLKDIL